MTRASPPRVLANRRVLITAGPTREAIDPVRFISNRSSGKMGYAVAEAVRAAGAQVVLVSGPVSLPTPQGVRRVDVVSAQQMYDVVHQNVDGVDLFIAAAAVSDYRPVQAASHKIKKRSERLTLELTRTPDILSSVAALGDRPFTVGFAAETDEVEAHALEKLESKGLDMIAANRVGETLGFDTEDNALLVLWPGGRRELPAMRKNELARALVELIGERYALRRSEVAR